MKNARLIGFAAALCSSLVIAAEVDVSKLPPASERKGVTFATDIQPLFAQSCVKCHGAEKPKARLRLDSLEAALKGSENGKVIRPGESAKSLLIQSVGRVLHEDEWMPPPGNKFEIKPLTPQEIGLIRAWIDQGAK